MISGILKSVRRIRSRLSRWSSREDRLFHDELFGAAAHDPFSVAYPGYITIRRFADLAAQHLSNVRAVLDLGCGPGEITCELGRRFPHVQFHGVDHSAAAIDRARANAAQLKLSNVTFERSDLDTFSRAEPVDLILMFDAFHHLVTPAEFVGRMKRICDRFFLIEPAGDAIGRWRRAIDFDWLPSELDKIRARTEHLLLEQGRDRTSGPAGRDSGGGRAVEHRYPLSDYEAFFRGFQISVRGTVAGLDVYPPAVDYDSPWRRTAMETSYQWLRQVDDRLVAQGLDLHAKHWAIYVCKDGAAQSGRQLRARPPAGRWHGDQVRGPYDVRYAQPDVPPWMAAGKEARIEITVHNESWRTLSSEPAEHSVHVSYRWLDKRRQPVEREGLRSSLPRPLGPGETCRVAVRVEAPVRRGVYFLELDLVEEGVSWFSEAGVPPLRVRVRVS